jgi:hypothetical protein
VKGRALGLAALVAGALLWAACSSLAASGSTASASGADRGLETGFGDYAFESTNPKTRDFLFSHARSAGAGIVRLEVSWREVVHGPPTVPSNPADPAYDFSVVDAAVRDANAQGLDVMLTIASAPDWAEGPGRPDSSVAPSGSWKPDTNALGAFARAVATRYSGVFAPPGQGVLPHVRYYQAWNEPNLLDYLTPQWQGNTGVAAPYYARMLNAFYDGVKSVNGGDVVVSAGLAPYGDPTGQGRTRPLQFLRQLLCLQGRKSLTPTSCSDPAKFDVLADHPINTSGSPLISAQSPDDVTIADLGHVRTVLRAAESKGTVGAPGHHPIWATEFWFQSRPPAIKPQGVPPPTQARWIELALYELWKNGASVAMNLQVQDAGFDSSGKGLGVQAGLLYPSGRKKPAFTAFSFPFVVTGHGRLSAWLKAPEAGKVAIQRRSGRHWRTVASFRASAGGVYKRSLGSAGGRFRAKIGNDRSLVWRHG